MCDFIRRVLRTPTLTPKRSVRVPQVRKKSASGLRVEAEAETEALTEAHAEADPGCAQAAGAETEP